MPAVTVPDHVRMLEVNDTVVLHDRRSHGLVKLNALGGRCLQLLAAGDVGGAARMLGRPAEVEGIVVAGDARGGTLGFPTANLAVPADLLVPAYGIYAGSAEGRRAAISSTQGPASFRRSSAWIGPSVRPRAAAPRVDGRSI